jgi:cobalamin biosynthesis protein CbiM
MHMADALLSPGAGGAMLAVAAGTIAYSSAKVREEMDDRKVPLMGVMGAFLFAAQMINFTIPATGSSGHIGGGLLLAVLLGPHAAFLTIASVLMVQALFFADGGLLALGCNIFNLGALPAFIAYPLIYRPIAGRNPSTTKARWKLHSQDLASFTTFVSLVTDSSGIGVIEGVATPSSSASSIKPGGYFHGKRQWRNKHNKNLVPAF